MQYCFFEEMIIVDDFSVSIVIGEGKDSAEGNINVVRTRELALGCYASCSMHDPGNPFSVLFFRTGSNVRGKAFVPAYKQKKERDIRGQPVRVFLQSDKGRLMI